MMGVCRLLFAYMAIAIVALAEGFAGSPVALRGAFRHPHPTQLRQASPVHAGGAAGLAMAVGGKRWERGFSFSVAGLLFPYHLGVADELRQNGLLKDGTPLAGASGGAIAAVIVALKLDSSMVINITQKALSACRAKGSARFKLSALLREELEEILPEDAADRLNAWQGGVSVGVTLFKPLPRGQLISQFDSKKDVINAILASCHIPLWVSRAPTARFRGLLALDGYFGNIQSFGCPPTAAQATTCVSPFGASQVFGLTSISFTDALRRLLATVNSVGRTGRPPASRASSVTTEGKPGPARAGVIGGVQTCFGRPVISPELLSREGRGRATECVPLALDVTDDENFVRRMYEDGRRDAKEWIRRGFADAGPEELAGQKRAALGSSSQT